MATLKKQEQGEINLGQFTIAAGMAGVFVSQKDLDMLLTIYDFVKVKGGDTNIRDIAKIRAEIDQKYKDINQ